MEYYYLNADHKPQGPYSQAELMALLLQGSITPATRIAPQGTDTWQPLGVVFSRPPAAEQAAAGATDAAPRGDCACPACHHSLASGTQPDRCPHCGTLFGRGDLNIIVHFINGFRRMFNFTGRATRAEFWSIAIPMFLLAHVSVFISLGLWGIVEFIRLMIEMGFFRAEADIQLLTTATTSLSSTAIVTAGIGIIAFFILTSAQARRLHDAGYRAWPAIVLGALTLVNWGIIVLYIGACLFSAAHLQELAAYAHSFPSLEAFQEHLIRPDSILQQLAQSITQAAPQDVWRPVHLAINIFSYAGFVLTVFVIVISFFNSEPRPNAYGPAAKHPIP